ncbi:MAG: hypothetical protein KGL45_09735, partial [Gammaproteobacteria bacterium]|nr:hypothetical protein [Gammaproteobacteria bacterium]
GLLEMSRQRLRPSLGESSHIVCPRCVGIGSIRSVESMTLAVLRLIGEELRKDRTVRVIAQLPVEVATYLFNEKREWLRTLEDRSSAELVIVPNPNMQTPGYSIRRVRDDEVDLPENRQTSYLMPSAPEPAEPGGTRDKRPPAEVPAVAALLPSTPAPILSHAAPVPAAPPAPESIGAEHRANGGLRAWFKKLFASEGETVQPAPLAEAAQPAATPASGSAHRSHGGGERRRDGRREHSSQSRRSEGGQRRGHGDGRRAEGRGNDGRDRSRREHDRDHERRQRDRDVNARPAESAMSAPAAVSGEEPRSGVEVTGEQRQVGGDRVERGERGERRGRRRGRRGGGRHGGGGAGREAGARESAGLTGAPAAGQEGGAAEFSGGASSNGAHEHHREPVVPRESFAAPEPREVPARHEEPAAPLAHFEPSPPTESHAPRETKPYVVWSSTPSDHAASSGGGRGPEE